MPRKVACGGQKKIICQILPAQGGSEASLSQTLITKATSDIHYSLSNVTSETGFYDKSLWEEAETKGKAALQRLIDGSLNNTSVTCFLIGQKTHERPWCKPGPDNQLRYAAGNAPKS